MPGDLNLKKSWHPGLIKNQKKLWEQEQDALNEHLKIKAKNDELKLEKEKQDLIKLQYGDTTNEVPIEVKRELNNLNWMYNDSKTNTNNNSKDEFNEMDNEFLLGKRKVENMLSGNKYIETNEVSRFEETVKSSKINDSKVENDPLQKIKNEQSKRIQSIKGSDRRHSSDEKHRSRDRSPHRHHSRHRHGRSRETRDKKFSTGSHEDGNSNDNHRSKRDRESRSRSSIVGENYSKGSSHIHSREKDYPKHGSGKKNKDVEPREKDSLYLEKLSY